MKKAAILGLLAIGAAFCQQPIASPIVIGGGGSGGGDTFASVSLKTTSYPMAAGIGDCYVPFVFTGAGNNTFTLLATPPSTNCQISVQNNSSGTLTVPPTSGFAGGVIAACSDGGLCPVTVIKTNGTTWYGTLPGGSGTVVTAAPPYLVIGGASYLPFGFLATQPPTSGWTATNCASGCTFTTTGANGAIAFTSASLAGASEFYQGETQAIGATTTLIVAVSATAGGPGSFSWQADKGRCGIGIANSSTLEARTVGGFWSVGRLSYPISGHWTNSTTWDFDTDNGGLSGIGNISWYKITYTGGTYTAFYSENGSRWTQIDNRTGLSGYNSWLLFAEGGTAVSGSSLTCEVLHWSQQ